MVNSPPSTTITWESKLVKLELVMLPFDERKRRKGEETSPTQRPSS
jgi:hypothetical protein